MDQFDIPIFKLAYDLYRNFYSYRDNVVRLDRYTIWQRVENIILDIVEGILLASRLSKSEKLPVLQKTSLKLNFLRMFLRLLKDVKTLDNTKYLKLQSTVDEIGRMLGGWIKTTVAVN